MAACQRCGYPLSRPSTSPWKIGLYVVSALLIGLGILFLWAAPVANTGSRLIVGMVMISLGVIMILLLRRGGRSAQRRSLEGAGDERSANAAELTCKVCGAKLGEDSVSLVNGRPRLFCPRCKSPYEVEEEPKW